MDAYNLMQDMRDVLGEATAAHWSDRLLLKCLNRAQLRIYMELSQTAGDWFLTSKSVTFASGVGELPADCAKPAFLVHPTSKNLVDITMDPRRQGGQVFPTYTNVNSAWRGYLYGNTIKLSDTFSGALTLWYDYKCQGLHTGTAAAGGSGSLTLASSPASSFIDDYYINLYMLVLSGTGSVTRTIINDYVGLTRVCVIDGTYSTDSVYSMESRLPDEAEDYMLALANYMAYSKPSGLVDKNALQWLASDLKKSKEMFDDWVSTRVKDNVHTR